MSLHKVFLWCVESLKGALGGLSLIFILSLQSNAEVAADTLSEYISLDKRYEFIEMKVNDGRVGIIAGGFGGTYLRIASDLKSVIERHNKGKPVRVVPMINDGSLQGILDIRHLKATEMGIVQADVMGGVQKLRARGNKVAKDLDQNLRYITKLYNEEVHLIGRGLSRIGELRNKRVNLGPIGSGTRFTASQILDRLNIPLREQFDFNEITALEKLQQGKIDAMFYVVGKPAPLLVKIGNDTRYKELRLVQIPFIEKLGSPYVKSILTDADYPNLMSERFIETIAVPAVLAVYNFDDRRRKGFVDRFVKEFVRNIDKLYAGASKDSKLYHAKWREFVHKDYLNDIVSGWKRYQPVTELLNGSRENSGICNDSEIRAKVKQQDCVQLR